MIVDPQTIPSAAMYQFMISVIVPRPIAFVSTVSAEGGHNIAPFSFYIGISSNPPLVGIAINTRAGEPKDTLRNVRDTGEFVINTVTEDLAARMVETSGDWPADVDEIALTRLTPIPSDRVKPPRLAESPVNLECRLYREIELGATFLVVGEIVRAHVADEILTDGRVDVLKLRPLGRLGGDAYSPVHEVIRLPRPKVLRHPEK